MNAKNISDEKLKKEVKNKYSGLVTSKRASSCCTPQTSCCSSTDNMKGNLVKLAGYNEELLKKLPAESVENSFGCGNPLAFSEVKEGQIVLDIGSGAGIDCFIASEKVGKSGRVIGIDMTPEMINKAEENAKSGGYTNVEFRLGDAENMPVENESVDWVISNCVINLSPNKPKVFSEIVRILKPGGHISISDIVLGDDLPSVITDNIAAWTGCIAGAITETEYIEGLKEAGLSQVYVDSRITYNSSVVKKFLEAYVDSKRLDEVNRLLKEVDGKIWSAKIKGKK